MPKQLVSFNEYLVTNKIDASLAQLLEQITLASIAISDHLKVGAINDILGSAGSDNVQGEVQKKLDIISNDEFVKYLSKVENVAALISEEVEEIYWLKDEPQPEDLIVYFDPLDGSSNLEVNLSVGSIFSISKIGENFDKSNELSILHAGNKQICAGYTVYGPSTSLVVTTGKGVDGFTYDEKSKQFILSYKQMKVPQETGEYAINTSYYQFWDTPIKRYVDECVAGENGPRGKKYNMRWTASMVADVHRILVRGGVFMYPKDANNQKAGGKLRLMYEANPMSFLIEQAGGAASTGYERIMDVTPTSPHQRVAVLLGSKAEIVVLNQYHKDTN